MKKILFAVLLSTPIFLFLPSNIRANCVPRPADTCPTTQCTWNKTSYCCARAQECTDLKNKATPIPTAAPTLNPSSAICPNDPTGINTAIGCIHVLSDTAGSSAFLGDILRWAIGIGGGIAFLLCLYAGFIIMTSAGNPERLKAGQELLTSAISGLILLVLSIFILRFIGIDILGLGVFGFGQ